jgi:hypothetical protein
MCSYFAIDLYGSGPDQRAITRAFHGRRNSVNLKEEEEEAEMEVLQIMIQKRRMRVGHGTTILSRPMVKIPSIGVDPYHTSCTTF